jgi:hypothetical protein
MRRMIQRKVADGAHPHDLQVANLSDDGYAIHNRSRTSPRRREAFLPDWEGTN